MCHELVQHTNVLSLDIQMKVIFLTAAVADGVFDHSLKDVPHHTGFDAPWTLHCIQAPPTQALPTVKLLAVSSLTSLPNTT